MTFVLGVAAVICALVLAGVCWVVYGLLRQNGRLLLRIEVLEIAIEQLATQRRAAVSSEDGSLARSRINRNGLPAGSFAPGFRLPLLDGGHVALADFAGRRLLLVFSDPECGPCTALLPRLETAARQAGVAVLIVSRGGIEANRRKVAETGVSLPIALQAHWEISRLYAKFSTPMAYLIDERGRTVTEVASGGSAILALLEHGTSDVMLPGGPMHPAGSRLTH